MQPIAALSYARRLQGLSTLVVTLACAAYSTHAATGALMGGALMALHGHLLLVIARFWFAQTTPAGQGKAAGLLLAKFFIMAALTAVVLLVLQPNPLGFILGLATFVVAMAWAFVRSQRAGSTHPAPPHAPRI